MCSLNFEGGVDSSSYQFRLIGFNRISELTNSRSSKIARKKDILTKSQKKCGDKLNILPDILSLRLIQLRMQ